MKNLIFIISNFNFIKTTVLITLLIQFVSNSQIPQISLYFDGYNDFIDCGANSILKPSNQITVSAWIRVQNLNEWQSIIWCGSYYENHYAFKVMPDNKVRGLIWINGPQTIFSESILITNKWYHIAFTYDSFKANNNFQLFINGSLEVQINVSGNIGSDNNPFIVGVYPGLWNQYLNGNIAGIQVWNRSLDSLEIQQKMNGISNPLTEIGLVGYWPINEGQGNIIYDLSGNNNHGTVYGAHWVPTNNLNAVISTENIWLDEDYDGFANKIVDASLSSGEITSYTWMVGNDTVGFGINPVIFLPTGSQYLKLIVRDSVGASSTDSIMISVYSAKFITEGPIYSAVSQLNSNTFFISSTDDRVYQFDSTGVIKWTYQTGGDIQSTVSVSDGENIFVTSSDTRLYSFDNAGIPNWDRALGGIIVSTPTINEGSTIFVGMITGRLFAISYDGNIKWSVQTGDDIVASPVIDSDGKIYFGSKDGKQYAVSNTGDILWTYQTLDSIFSSSALGIDSTVIFCSSDGYLYKVDMNGNLLWKYNTTGAIYASPIIGEDGRIFIGSSNGFFYAISSDGNLIWKVNTNAPIKSTAALSIDGSTIFVGTESGKIMALSVDGSYKWYLQTENSVSSPILVTNNNLVFSGNTNGAVYILKANTDLQSKKNLEWPTFLANNRRTGNQNSKLTGIKENDDEILSSFQLRQNFPNPFNPNTTISFLLPKESKVNIWINNILGERIKEFDLGIFKRGSGKIIWNASNHSSGIYYYTLLAIPTDGSDGFQLTKKMILLK